MLEDLKEKVCKANLELVNYNLVILTWGNVSAIDRNKGLVVIKPSGVPYDTMKPEDMVVMELDGRKYSGRLNPSSDTPTHLEIYRNFPDVGAIVHTHSPWAVSWAQAGRDIPVYGTTHADFAYGCIPCTRALTKEEVENDYELNTGKVIVREFSKRGIKPSECPAVLVKRHGPFVWGKDEFQAVENALILEEIARMAFQTENIASLSKEGVNKDDSPEIEDYLLDKHYLRKHGKDAYYGQNNKQDRQDKGGFFI